MILGEGGISARPLHKRKICGDGFMAGGLFASHSKLKQKDIVVEEASGEFSICWTIPKALPHLPVFSEGLFLIGARNSGPIELLCSIFAENLKRPIQTTLTLDLEIIAKDLTLKEIQNFSEAFSMEDIRSGTGRLPY